MDRQKYFNIIYKHMMCMESPSLSGANCAYRGDDGAKCAIGILIKDKYYNPALEGLNITHSAVKQALIKSGVDFYDVGDLMFLESLQDVHDNYFKNRGQKLHEIAVSQGLSIPSLIS